MDGILRNVENLANVIVWHLSRLLVKSHYARLDFLKMFTVQSYRRMCMKDSLFSMFMVASPEIPPSITVSVSTPGRPVQPMALA
ncbi:hypothetical protein PAL_GLEAN10023137 [Pteropus alecto]|uniref:Uncharacterized protein n=1 Tax=Pteropus alecto TaxID=9402 RepID=L5K283_PTEAL|nr:hypothetical protein PAL_GLEAN10023137 [Pteropus alecto]